MAEIHVIHPQTEQPLARFHGHYKSLHRNTPHHIGGLCWATGQWLLTP